MSEHYPHDEELDDLAARLAQLVPNAAGLRRDRILFEAGRRAGCRQARYWNFAALGLAGCFALIASWNIAQRPEVAATRTSPAMVQSDAAPEEVVVVATDGNPVVPAPALGGSSYLTWRHRLASGMIDELSTPRSSGSGEAGTSVDPTSTRRSLERELIAEFHTPA